jgi:hypothetical protein
MWAVGSGQWAVSSETLNVRVLAGHHLIFDGLPPETVSAGNGAMSSIHRGPDEGGHLGRSPVAGLVHRRLRIIDLSPLGAHP